MNTQTEILKKNIMATKTNMDRHIREGWTVGAFIRELAPQVEMIMSGQSWRKPFRNKQELADWCRDNQPYYKKRIPEVNSHFARTENAISSFFYYMWNAWNEEECKVVYGDMHRHFWEKWCQMTDKGVFGAAERFYAELTDHYREKLAERAVALYDGKARRKEQNEELVYVCAACGSILFEATVWINTSTGGCMYVYDNDDGCSEEWCGECGEIDNCCTMKDFKEKMRIWWNTCDFKTMERITGLKVCDYPSEDGARAFVNAATEWWNGLDYDRKRKIHNEYNPDNEE